ncbi:hypothetical protein JW968_06140 [Candidatus Woesearchaeota archaeon]|nr:hypothetical protein [Candidatus Woesearchaeota archaeon]
MNEYLNDSKQEINRADHLIYVSLKYTRTVDVIKSIIERIINAYDFLIEGILQQALDEERISEKPVAAIQKAEKVRELYSSDESIISNMDFYLNLRKINRAKFTRFQEFRRHVTMTAIFDDNSKQEVNIDIIMEYYGRTKEFFSHVSSLLKEGEPA